VQSKHELDAKKYTFEVAAEQYIDSKRAEWRNKKHATQWLNTLKANAFPFIGDMPVRDIEKADVIRCLDPIWKTKTETASRVRGRIEAILDYAQVSGWRSDGVNPARWKGHLSTIYPSPVLAKKVRDIEAGSDGHHPAMAFDELPEFFLRLSNQAGVASQALQLTILTAVRTASIRFAKWSQFDLDKKLWIIPAGNMKSAKESRVALNDHAIDLLKEMPRLDDWVFVGGKQGKPLSDGAMLSLLRRMDRTDVTVHGFRSTFRDWVGEETNFPTNLAEYALAHKLGNETERAYARGDQLEKRRELMEAWGSYVTGLGKASPQPSAVGNDF
jgi:integrase